MRDPKYIKPCPFCGSWEHPQQPIVSIIRWPRGSSLYRFCVACCVCGAHGPIMPTEQDAVDAYMTGYKESENWDSLRSANSLDENL